eukprot:31394-Pelagococcus_subviridis.AAC.2
MPPAPDHVVDVIEMLDDDSLAMDAAGGARSASRGGGATRARAAASALGALDETTGTATAAEEEETLAAATTTTTTTTTTTRAIFARTTNAPPNAAWVAPGDPIPRAPSPSAWNHHLRASVTATVDALWQERPPRLLTYSPSALHTLGWLPFLTSWRNLRVTAFASWTLHAQSACLVAWTAALHVTRGLGVPQSQQRHFCAIFSTSYLGSLSSFGVITTLVLGLFISLVVQRWWEVRTQYATMHSAIIDVAVAFTSSTRRIRRRARPDGDGEEVITFNTHDDDDSTVKEFLRLLNLTHVLFLSQAGDMEHTVDAAKALRGCSLARPWDWHAFAGSSCASSKVRSIQKFFTQASPGFNI